MRIGTTLLILLLAGPLAGSEITPLWIGGIGDWTDPAQWSPAGVPNNGASTYLVTVNSGAVDVANIFTQNIYLDGITVGAQSTVHVNDQGLVLGSPASASALLTNAGTVNLTNAASLTLDYSAGAPAANSGTILVGDESAIYLTAPGAGGGTFTNTGSIALQANPHGSQIYLYGDGAAFTLNGGGNLTLSDNPANLITGSFGTETLVSDNKLSGAGTIAMLANFTNNGTVVANGTNSLVFNMDNGTAGVTGTIVNNGSIQVASGGSLILQGSADLKVTNNGTITLNAQGAQVSVLLYNDNNTGSALHLSGPGELSLSDNVNNIVAGAYGDETLVNGLGHTISGAGTIGNFKVIDNGGTIAASGTNPLILNLSGTAAAPGELINSGTLQVNDGSTLQFRSLGVTVNNEGLIALNAAVGTSTLSFDDSGAGALFTISNTAAGGGRIAFSDNPGNRIVGVNGTESLFLGNGQQLSGAGTIGNFSFIDNHGTITANGANPLVIGLSNTANPFGNLENAGAINVSDGSTIVIDSGAWIDNVGSINLNVGAHTSTLAFNDAQPMLLGSATTAGQLVMSDNPGNRIVGVTGQETLINNSAHTIQGAGTIANFGGGFVNNGTVLANGVNSLVIDIGAATVRGIAGVTNGGLIEIGNGSTLQVLSSSGGTVLTASGGELFLASTATGTSTLSFNDQGHSQTFTLAANSGGTDSVVMSIGGNRITGVSGDETLINGVNSTIVGQGVISNFAQFVNNGTLQTGGGVLEVQAPLGNWNGATGALTGGTYIADGGSLKLDSLGSQTITNLAGANVTLQGAGVLTGNGTVNALGGLVNVVNSSVVLDAASTLTITPGGGTLTLTDSTLTPHGGSLVINGNLSVNAASILETLSGGSLSVNGTLSQDATSNIVVGNSTSLAAGDFFNGGSIVLNAGSTASFKGAVSNSGLVEVLASAQFSVLRSPFLAFGTNVYTQTAGTTKVLTGGTLNAATVDLEGGTLGGGGTINANVVLDGGTLAPGDPTTTDINGDLTVNGGGDILLDIDGAGDGLSDSLYIAGNLNLNGGKLDIVFENGFLPEAGDTWNLLSFTGTEDGVGFAHIVFENAGNEQLGAFFNGQNFELETQGGETAPEPRTFPLLLTGLVGVTLSRMCVRLRKRGRTANLRRTNSEQSRGFPVGEYAAIFNGQLENAASSRLRTVEQVETATGFKKEARLVPHSHSATGTGSSRPCRLGLKRLTPQWENRVATRRNLESTTRQPFNRL